VRGSDAGGMWNSHDGGQRKRTEGFDIVIDCCRRQLGRREGGRKRRSTVRDAGGRQYVGGWEIQEHPTCRGKRRVLRLSISDILVVMSSLS